jgi:hypothetical protein
MTMPISPNTMEMANNPLQAPTATAVTRSGMPPARTRLRRMTIIGKTSSAGTR